MAKVLSGSSSFQYKGKQVNYSEIAEELQVTHIVEGSVRKAGDNLRITARLINALDAQTLWAERYDRSGNELFVLQDKLIRNIVNSMSLKLTNREKKLLEHPTTSDFKAYDLYLKGRQFMTQRTANANRQAQTYYQQAINTDPSFARAHGALAVAKIMAANNYWGDDPEVEKRQALDYAIKATQLTKDSQHVYWALGFTHLYLKQHDKAKAAVEQSLKIAPNYADAYALLALINNNMGLAKESISLIPKAMYLNPLYSWDYLFNLGWAHYTLGEYEKSEELLLKALERNPNSRLTRLILIANYIASNMEDEAEWQVDELLLQYPELNMQSIQNNMPLIANQTSVRFLANLKKAGIPD